MTNCNKVNAIAGKTIMMLNTDDDPEQYAKDILEMKVKDLFDTYCSIIAIKLDIEDGDNEAMKKALNEVTLEQVTDWAYEMAEEEEP